MKITDMILSGILRKGILYEAKNCNVDFEIPLEQCNEEGENKNDKVRVHCTIDNMTLRLEKGRSE